MQFQSFTQFIKNIVDSVLICNQAIDIELSDLDIFTERSKTIMLLNSQIHKIYTDFTKQLQKITSTNEMQKTYPRIGQNYELAYFSDRVEKNILATNIIKECIDDISHGRNQYMHMYNNNMNMFMLNPSSISKEHIRVMDSIIDAENKIIELVANIQMKINLVIASCDSLDKKQTSDN